MSKQDNIDNRNNQEEQGAGVRPSPLLGFGAFGFLGLIDLAAHLGSPGLLAAILAGIIAWNNGNDLVGGAKKVGTGLVEDFGPLLPQPVQEKLADLAAISERKQTDEVYQDREQDQYDSPEIIDAVLSVARLYLGEDFEPEADSLLSKRIGLFGNPGSGKSNALTVFIEEIGKLGGIGVPFVLADTEGEAASLLSPDYLMRQYHAGAHNVTSDNAFKFGQSVLARGRQVILDLQSYEDDDVAALVMIDIIRGMNAWANAHENDDRAACFFILDEAAYWLPQRQEESGLSKVRDKQTKQTLLQRLQKTFFSTVVRRGRKRGIGFLFATQRPADLDNRAVSCDWLFLFRQTHPSDLEVYKKMDVKPLSAQSLQPGECIVIDPSAHKVRHRFRKRNSPDNAKSPGLSSLSRHSERWQGDDEEYRDEFDEDLPDDDDPLNDVPGQGITLTFQQLRLWLESGQIDDKQFFAMFQQLLDEQAGKFNAGASASTERRVRPDEGQDEEDNDTRRSEDQTAQKRPKNAVSGQPGADMYAHKNDVRRPLEKAQGTNNVRTGEEAPLGIPLLDELQVELFVTAFVITGSIDESLKRAGANTRYRAHARRIIQERGLRKRA